MTCIKKASKPTLVDRAMKLRDDFAREEGGYRVKLWGFIADAFGVALQMSHNQEAYREFLEHDFWKNNRKKRPAASSVLLNMMVFVFNGIEGNAYSRAWKFAKALEAHFNQGVPSEEITDIIKKAGGIEAMLKKAKKKSGPDEEWSPSDLDADDMVDELVDEQKEAQEERDEDDSPAARKPSARPATKDQGGIRVSEKGKVRAEGGVAKTLQPQDSGNGNCPSVYQLLVAKKRAAQIERLVEGQKAQLMIEMVERQGQLFPEMIELKAFKPMKL